MTFQRDEERNNQMTHTTTMQDPSGNTAMKRSLPSCAFLNSNIRSRSREHFKPIGHQSLVHFWQRKYLYSGVEVLYFLQGGTGNTWRDVTWDEASETPVDVRMLSQNTGDADLSLLLEWNHQSNIFWTISVRAMVNIHHLMYLELAFQEKRKKNPVF